MIRQTNLLFALVQVVEVNGCNDDNPVFTVTCLHGAGSGSLGQLVWTMQDVVKGLPR